MARGPAARQGDRCCGGSLRVDNARCHGVRLSRWRLLAAPPSPRPPPLMRRRMAVSYRSPDRDRDRHRSISVGSGGASGGFGVGATAGGILGGKGSVTSWLPALGSMRQTIVLALAGLALLGMGWLSGRSSGHGGPSHGPPGAMGGAGAGGGGGGAFQAMERRIAALEAATARARQEAHRSALAMMAVAPGTSGGHVGGDATSASRFPAVKALPAHLRKRILVTGGAGFVGSHLVDALMMQVRGLVGGGGGGGLVGRRFSGAQHPPPHPLVQGHTLYVVDNLHTGRTGNIAHWMGHPHFTFLHVRRPAVWVWVGGWEGRGEACRRVGVLLSAGGVVSRAAVWVGVGGWEGRSQARRRVGGRGMMPRPRSLTHASCATVSPSPAARHHGAAAAGSGRGVPPGLPRIAAALSGDQLRVAHVMCPGGRSRPAYGSQPSPPPLSPYARVPCARLTPFTR
jgi:hypothetical protein